MKRLAKLIIFLLCAVVLAMSTVVFAADSGDIIAYISGATARAGAEITITVSIKNSPGIAGAEIHIAYDSDVMSYVSTTGLYGGVTVMGSTSKGANPVKVVMADLSLNEHSGDFDLASVKFRISDTAAAGRYDMDIVAFKAYDSDVVDIPSDVVGSTVVIKSDNPSTDVSLPGDVDGDGSVTIRDAARILQYKAGWDVEINLDASDVDGDGNVTIRDAARILQYKAGWDVTLSGGAGGNGGGSSGGGNH